MTNATESARAVPLLPTRASALARLTEQLPATEGTPACLLVIGLRRDDGRPTPASTLAQVTMLLASSLRAEDWLAGLGIVAAPGSFYGPAGSRHVRLALTATDERIAAAVERLQ